MDYQTQIVVLGSTGLVGQQVCHLLAQRKASFIALCRRPISGISAQHQLVPDFKHIDSWPRIQARTLINCLGTTIKTAGSRSAFHAIDTQLPIDIVTALKQNGLQRVINLSAVGANPHSPVFYNRCKGELQVWLDQQALQVVHLQPGLLLGERNESRPLEHFSQKLTPLINRALPARFRGIDSAVLAQKIVSLAEQENWPSKPLVGEQLY